MNQWCQIWPPTTRSSQILSPAFIRSIELATRGRDHPLKKTATTIIILNRRSNLKYRIDPKHSINKTFTIYPFFFIFAHRPNTRERVLPLNMPSSISRYPLFSIACAEFYVISMVKNVRPLMEHFISLLRIFANDTLFVKFTHMRNSTVGWFEWALCMD